MTCMVNTSLKFTSVYTYSLWTNILSMDKHTLYGQTYSLWTNILSMDKLHNAILINQHINARSERETLGKL